MAIDVYLTFNGNCCEAVDFYSKVLIPRCANINILRRRYSKTCQIMIRSFYIYELYDKVMFIIYIILSNK